MSESSIAQVVRHPRLSRLFNSILPTTVEEIKERTKQLLLSENDRSILESALKTRHTNCALYDAVMEGFSKEESAQIYFDAYKTLEKLFTDDQVSLRLKVMENKSDCYAPFVQVFEIPKHSHEANVKRRNILFLNRGTQCYTFNEDVKQLLDTLYKSAYHGSIVFSATTVDAIPLFATREIQAIYNQDWGMRSGPRADMDSVIMALRVAAGDEKETKEMRALYDHVRMLPMNTDHGNLSEFLKILERVKPLKKEENTIW